MFLVMRLSSTDSSDIYICIIYVYLSLRVDYSSKIKRPWIQGSRCSMTIPQIKATLYCIILKVHEILRWLVNDVYHLQIDIVATPSKNEDSYGCLLFVCVYRSLSVVIRFRLQFLKTNHRLSFHRKETDAIKFLQFSAATLCKIS